VKVTQLSARIDAQILRQNLPQPAERVEGLRLTPVPVQRQHQLAPPPLTQRAARHQGLEPADNLVVVTQRQFGIKQVLQRCLAQLPEPHRRRGRERTISELPQGRPPPQVQGPPQQPGGRGRIAACHLPATRRDQALRQDASYRPDSTANL